MTHLNQELEQLRWQNQVLKEKLWSKQLGEQRRSDWMFLVNTRYKPPTWVNFNHKEAFCDQMMQEFAEAVRDGQIVTLNRKKHKWTTDFIDSIRVKYVVELGKGKMKLDGTKGEVGGYVHIHARLTIFHKSNITLTWEKLKEFFDPPCWLEFGEHPFIGHPRLVMPDRVEEYFSKSFESVEWKVIELDKE